MQQEGKVLSTRAASGGSFDPREVSLQNPAPPPESRPSGDTELLLSARAAELRRSEALYRTLIEHAPEAIVVVDGDTGVFTEANENALRLFGVERATLMKLGPGDVSSPIQADGQCSREAAFAKMKEALGTTGVPMFEWVNRDCSGRDLPCEVRVAKVPLPGRNLFIVTVADISERKALEAKLAVFAALVERTTDTVGIADMQERLVYINPATRRMLGLSDDENVTGKSFSMFFTPEANRLIREEGIPHALHHQTWDKELGFQHRDGSEVPAAMNGMVIRDPKG